MTELIHRLWHAGWLPVDLWEIIAQIEQRFGNAIDLASPPEVRDNLAWTSASVSLKFIN